MIQQQHGAVRRGDDAHRQGGNTGEGKGFGEEIACVKCGDERVIAAGIAGDHLSAAFQHNAENSGWRSLMENDWALFGMDDLGAEQIQCAKDFLTADVKKERTV